jgi:alkanesulfonate monooxygenase SsuD/methylene tetrahydromethanopterin reductase-like flavin-dependent oxidoreductase (luciferase family)
VVRWRSVGGRPDDYAATAVDFETRGKTFDAQLAEFREVWGGASRGTAGAIGPRPVQPGGPPLLIGGTSAAAIRRTVKHGAGWIAGGGGPQMFAQGAEQVRRAWRDSDRDGAPRLAAFGYFALGPDAPDLASAYLRHYYAFIPDYVDFIVGGALTSDEALRAAMAEFAEAGCDELILFPCSPNSDQLRRLADLGLVGRVE